MLSTLSIFLNGVRLHRQELSASLAAAAEENVIDFDPCSEKLPLLRKALKSRAWI